MWSPAEVKTLISNASPQGEPLAEHSLETTVESLAVNAIQRGMTPREFVLSVRNWALSEIDRDADSIRMKLCILRAAEASVMRRYKLSQLSY